MVGGPIFMTFKERYEKETTWHGKATVMEIFHLTACHSEKNWTISKTAIVFDVSVSLASENLKLASALHKYPKLIHAKSRQDALKKVNGR